MLQQVRNWLQKYALNNARFTIAVTTILGLMLFVTSCSTGDTSSLPQLQTAPAHVGEIEITMNTVGSIKPAREQWLTFDTSGTLISLYAVEAEEVQARDVLARIDATTLEQAVIQAEADLTVAQDNLEKAQNPYTELDLIQAKLAVAQAEVALEEAKENLEKVRNPATELDLTEARLAVDQAKTKLEEAKENLASVKAGPTEAQLASAEAALATAEEKYERVLAGPDSEAVEQAKLGLDQARNSLWSAQVSRDSTCGSAAAGIASRASCDSANAQVLNAEISVRLAEISYQHAQAPATAAEIANAAAQVQEAKENLEQLRNSPTSLDLAQAETQVTQAEHNLAKAQENLAEIEAGPDPLEMTQAKTQVAQAKADLREKEEMLAKIKAGPDAGEVKEAQNRLEKAEISLEQARRNLENATLVAPFSGTIASVDVNIGDKISLNSKILHLVDLSHLRVETSVDEFDVGKVRVGQQAKIFLYALPDHALAGKLSKVAVMPAQGQGTAVYPVIVDISNPGHAIRPGMGAEANIVVAKNENMLLVPSSAIKESDGKEVIYILAEDQIIPVSVTLGISDEEVTEVVKGLEEGAQVITSSEEVIESFREYQEPSEKRKEGFWQSLKRFFMGLLGLGGE